MTAAAIGWTYLALLAGERGAELAVSARNARRALAAGAVESGRGHYAPMVALHALLLAGCVAEPLAFPAPWPLAATLGALPAALGAQALRWWSVAALGGRWTTRVVVAPGAAPVRRGPYRFLRHPNYLAVAVEGLAAPLVVGAWRTAIAFTVANAAVLAVRIRAEEAALGPAWAAAFERTPRLWPRASARAEARRP